VPKKKNSGQFQKGNNANPHGRAAPIVKAKNAPGGDGVIATGGYLQTGEANKKLTGRLKWREYANAYFRPAVSISASLRSALIAGAKWTLAENAAGGKAAAKGLDVVQRGLLDARLPRPWPIVARTAGMAYFEGFRLQSYGFGRRPDGLVTFTEFKELPCHTIQRWFRPTPRDRFDSVEQWLDTGERYTIDLADCFYFVNDMLTPSPEGIGMLRLVIDRVRRTNDYEDLEGSEVFSGMGGTPIARVPLEEISKGLTGTEEEITAKKRAKTNKIEKIVSDRIKTPQKRAYAVLDSATYQGSDPNTISTVPKWGIEIVKGDLQGLPDIRKIISESDLNDARVLGVDFVFGGGAGSVDGGAGRHQSQVHLFTAQLAADLVLLGIAGTQQLARRIVAANGLDPDEATPDLIASPISTEDVLKTTQALVQLNMAGLPANHPAKIAIFDRLSLPWQPEEEPVLPRVQVQVPADGGAIGDTPGQPGEHPQPGDHPQIDTPPGEQKPTDIQDRQPEGK